MFIIILYQFLIPYVRVCDIVNIFQLQVFSHCHPPPKWPILCREGR